MSLYLEGARVLAQKHGSLKSRIYGDGSLKSPRPRLYALVVETLKHQELLNDVISASDLLATEKKLTHPLALLLLHDFLLTKAGISVSTGPLKTAVLKHKARLSAEFTRARLRRGYATTAQLLAAHRGSSRSQKLPRWVRVNTLKTTVETVLDGAFSGYAVVESVEALLEETEQKLVFRDRDIPSLLGFPPSTDLTEHPLYILGALILQDKASCFPAHLLDPPANAYVVDGTAAPGNKTTHLAALLGQKTKGRIFAFEKDKRRGEVLKSMVAKAGGNDIIEVRAGEDLLKVDPHKDPGLSIATHVLLDPSCSGSGIVMRDEYELLPPPSKTAPMSRSGPGKGKKRKRVTVASAQPALGPAQEEEKKDMDKQRLASLAEFQKNIVQFAMSFPAARKITYSTCSIHTEENEDVVTAVLESRVAKRRGWRVLRREEGPLKDWFRRGDRSRCRSDEIAAACIRCNPVEDGGIGFFVVGFIRDGSVDGYIVDDRDEKGLEDGNGENTFGDEEWVGFTDEEVAPVPLPIQKIQDGARKIKRKKKKAKNMATLGSR